MLTANAVRNYADSWRATLKLVRSGYSWSGNERNCVFLNCTESSLSNDVRFSDASAISGLDFPDDGRAVAVVDWDHDGDLDLWLRNRTAPRLRLMLNSTVQLAPATQSVSLRLIGTQSNRDAIGARVVLQFKNSNQSHSRTQSIRAGDGFLSQSSKLIHFGLPSTATIEQLTIFWPGAKPEIIRDITAGSNYEVTQGTGQAEKRAHRSQVALTPKATKTLQPTAAARIIMPGRIPFPPMKLASNTDRTSAPSPNENQPTLYVFWTPTCSNCRTELTELVQHQADVRKAGLNLIAVCLEGAKSANDAPEPPQRQEGDRFLAEINFPFASANITPESLDLLNDFQNTLFSRFPDFVVPLCMLVDAEGQVISIYRGSFPISTFLDDAQLVELNDIELRTLSAPLIGTWITQPATRAQFADFVATRLLERQPQAAAFYFQVAADVETDPDSKKHRQGQVEQVQQLLDNGQTP